MKNILLFVLILITQCAWQFPSGWQNDFPWQRSSDGTGNVVSSPSSANVGIGTTGSVPNKLYVVGDIFATGSISDGSGAVGPWTLSGNNLYPTTLTNNVGIGKNNPAQALDVNGTISAIAYVASGSLTGQTNYIASNLGIGSSNPGAALDIQGTTRIFGNLGVGGVSPAAILDVQGSVRFASGNVGINLSAGAPVANLDVQGSVRILDSSTTANNLLTSGQVTLTSSGGAISSFTNTTLNFNNGGSTALIRNNSSTSASGLIVTGSNATNGTLQLKASGGSTSGDITAVVGNNGGTLGWEINGTTGNVGIGSATPGMKLDVQGTVRSSTTFIATNMATDAGQADSTVCAKTADGTFFKGSGTIGICLGTSTLRAKENIIPLPFSINQIMALKPIKFNYKQGWGYPTNKPYFGFLAEDVKDVLPELVGHNDRGETLNADYVGMIPVLVKAVQDLQHQVDDLKAKDDAKHDNESYLKK